MRDENRELVLTAIIWSFVVVAIATGLIYCSQASAMTILSAERTTYLDTQTYVIGQDEVNLLQQESTSEMGAWSSSLSGQSERAWATQQSLVSKMEISAIGSVRHYTDDWARTTLEVVFSTEATPFALTVVNEPNQPYLVGSANGSVELSTSLGELLYHVDLGRWAYLFGGTAAAGIDVSGVLPAGEYRLSYRYWDKATNNYSGSQPTSFLFSVPEPATWLLVVLGLILIATNTKSPIGRNR